MCEKVQNFEQIYEKKSNLTHVYKNQQKQTYQIEYNDYSYGENDKETTICQLKATHWSSMNDKETLTPLGRLQQAQKQHYAQKQRNSSPIHSSNGSLLRYML